MSLIFFFKITTTTEIYTLSLHDALPICQTVKDRYGSDFYGEIGRKGGSTTKKKYGPQHYSDIGRRGGQTTAERHGQEFYENIGRKGGQRVRELIERGKATDED